MESTIAASTQPQVIVGVDTHKQFHVAHAVDQLGRPLGSHRLAATPAGYRGFVSWAHELGRLVAVGIEGPGHFGAGLARHLRVEGIAVSEVGRPKRQRRARFGKSDDADAATAGHGMITVSTPVTSQEAPRCPLLVSGHPGAVHSTGLSVRSADRLLDRT